MNPPSRSGDYADDPAPVLAAAPCHASAATEITVHAFDTQLVKPLLNIQICMNVCVTYSVSATKLTLVIGKIGKYYNITRVLVLDTEKVPQSIIITVRHADLQYYSVHKVSGLVYNNYEKRLPHSE